MKCARTEEYDPPARLYYMPKLFLIRLINELDEEEVSE